MKDINFNYQQCIDNLQINSDEIREMIKLNQELLISSHSIDYNVNRFFEKASSPKIKSQIFSNKMIENINNSTLKKALNSEDIKLRQAAAQYLSTIPSELKTEYELLLNDKSYITIETALFNLWINFPQERKKYLDKTKGIQGFSDKNIRILWLALTLVSSDFEDKNIRKAYSELTDYTSPKFGFEIRQNAFQYLNEIKACNYDCQENLKQATKHPNWRFSKFAKEMLKVLEKN